MKHTYWVITIFSIFLSMERKQLSSVAIFCTTRVSNMWTVRKSESPIRPCPATSARFRVDWPHWFTRFCSRRINFLDFWNNIKKSWQALTGKQQFSMTVFHQRPHLFAAWTHKTFSFSVKLYAILPPPVYSSVQFGLRMGTLVVPGYISLFQTEAV